MSDLKWIKIDVDIFNDEKIKLIETMKNGENIIVIWFKLLALAGKQNNSGVFLLAKNIPISLEMFAKIFGISEKKIANAFEIFENFGMIETINGVVCLTNWEKHQNVENADVMRNKTRERVRKYREKQAEAANSCNADVTLQERYSNNSCNVTGNVTQALHVTPCNAVDKEEEKEEEGDIKKIEKESAPSAKNVTEVFNELCPSLSQVTKISDERKRAIKNCLKRYSLDEIKTAFQKAEKSNFCNGNNDRGWKATFDWIIKDANMAKLLDGNYDNRRTNAPAPKSTAEREDILRLAGYMQAANEITDEEYQTVKDYAEGKIDDAAFMLLFGNKFG